MKLFYNTFASATLTTAAAFGGLVANLVNLQAAQAAQFIVNSTELPPDVQTSFQYALDTWAPLIDSPVPIEIDVTFQPSPVANNLAAGNPLNFFSFSEDSGIGIPDTLYPVALANALSGTDLDPGNADIEININSSNPDWYYGTDPNVPAGQYDFVSSVLHEITHGLGFYSLATVNNEPVSVLPDGGYPLIYDRFVVNGSGQSIIDTTLFPNNSTELASQLQSDNLFFNGDNASAANGGSYPKLYAPVEWERGSSYVHLDDVTYLTRDNMIPYGDRGLSLREPGPITLGILDDIGYSVTPIPEPSPALGLLLFGVGIGAVKLKARLKLQPKPPVLK